MNISKIIVLLMLLGTGFFLGLWLKEQHQNELEALKNEALLAGVHGMLYGEGEGEQKGHDQMVVGQVLVSDSQGRFYDGEGAYNIANLPINYDEADMRRTAFVEIIPQIALTSSVYLMLVLSIFFLDKSHKRKRRFLESKNTFISNMTHELKTPVSTISIALEALEDFFVIDDKEKTREYLKVSRKQVEKLSGTIDQVLQMMKLDEQKPLFDFQQVDMDALVGKAVDSLQVKLDRKDIFLNYSPSPTPVLAAVDGSHFGNALYNLLDNAIKHSPPQGSIRIRLLQDAGHISLSVQDQGPGIPRQEQEAIFERFYRISSANVHDTKGTGLGLSYAQAVAEAHGGRISVESEVGRGATFTIKIPVSHG